MAAFAAPDPVSSSQRPDGLALTGNSPGSADTEHSVTIVGDLRVDISVQLGAYDFGPECARYTAYRDVSVVPGGTALSMCRAFAPHFNGRHLVSALGTDSYSELLRRAVNEIATDSTLRVVGSPNGLTISLFRDSIGSTPKSRFSLASPQSPYLSLDPDWVDRNLATALLSDILTMDCLLLLSSGSIAAAHSIAQAAQRADCLFAVDVVPHNVLDYTNRDEILRLLSGANLVTVELDTLAQIVDASSQPAGNRMEAEKLYHQLKPYLSCRHWVAIRFGALNIEYSLIFSSDGQLWETDSGAEIRSGGYPSGSEISAVEYKHIVSQWDRECDMNESGRHGK